MTGNITPGSDPSAWEPLGEALTAFHDGDQKAEIVEHDDFDRQVIPVSYFFRTPEQFPPLELKALKLARGRILDVGAGAGPHALALQERSLAVTAIDVLPAAVDIMRDRGVRDVRQASIYDFYADPFDTILLLMNGLGIAETLDGLPRLLDHARRLLKRNGQVLADSTDLRSRGEGKKPRLGDGRYVGELHVQLDFRSRKGPPFQHLYVDPETLAECAHDGGWSSEIILQPDDPGYLARLIPSA